MIISTVAPIVLLSAITLLSIFIAVLIKYRTDSNTLEVPIMFLLITTLIMIIIVSSVPFKITKETNIPFQLTKTPNGITIIEYANNEEKLTMQQFTHAAYYIAPSNNITLTEYQLKNIFNIAVEPQYIVDLKNTQLEPINPK